jgi:hypothetical protein
MRRDVDDLGPRGEEPTGDREPEAPSALDGHELHRAKPPDPGAEAVELSRMRADRECREGLPVLIDRRGGVALRVGIDADDDHVRLLLRVAPDGLGHSCR